MLLKLLSLSLYFGAVDVVDFLKNYAVEALVLSAMLAI